MTTLTDDQLFGAAPTEAEPQDDLADLLVDLGERAPRFAVVDESTAAWATDKIATYDERIARVKAQYKEMLAGLERDKGRFERRFLPELEAWFRANPPKKGKSIKLLTGTLAMRTVPGKAAALGVTDPAAALAWCQEQFPGAVVAVPTLEPATLLDHVRETGEAVPGVEILPGREEYESFSVKGAK